MERTVLIPMAALLVQAITQASPSPQLTEADAATASLRTTAANPGSYERRLGASGFEENKGQVKQTDGQPAPYVKFRLNDGGTNIFLLERGIAYQFNRMHDPEGYAELAHRGHLSSEDEARLDDLRKQRRLETYRMDMTLEGADPHAPITTEGRSADFTNYYLSGVEALDVRTFSKVVYHGVYPGIDWEITTTEKGFEQDFIVHPGADPSSIRMRFTGHEELYVDEEGRLVHGNRLGRFREQGPVSFQAAAEVYTEFSLCDDLLAFEVSDYDEARELRIDPTREWGTYYGGSEDDEARDLAVDGDGNVFMVGTTMSPESNWIATDNGFTDASFNEQFDGFMVKFDTDGNRLWGTYYGGEKDDWFLSCAQWGGFVVAAGYTNSPGLGTSGTQQPGYAGDFGAISNDAFLVRFDAQSGEKEWTTYYGRRWEDKGKACAIDPSGYIYLAGESQSAGLLGGSDTIALNGFQDEMLSLVNGFLAKFDSLGSRLWGTYYGGENPFSIGFCTDVATDADGNVVLIGAAGFDADDGSAYVSEGAHQTVHGSTIQPPGTGGDAYLAKFDSSGERQWGTYFGGADNENAWGVAVDGDGYIYMVGETRSDTGIYLDGYQSTLASDTDAYVAKFDAEGVLVWGTYIGGPARDEAFTVFPGPNGQVYVAGWTKSSSGIAHHGYQMTYGGGDFDGFLIGLRSDGERMVGSYYGGSEDELLLGAAFDADNSLFICGWTSSSNDTMISSIDGQQPFLNSTQDAFLAKFRPDCLGFPAGNQEQGTPCTDPDPCTIDDVYNATCICEGTIPQAGQIVGNTILGSGISYGFTVFPILPGAVYAWEVPDGWTTSDTSASSITIAPPFNGGLDQLCVSATLGLCTLSTSCISILVEPVGIQEALISGAVSIQPNPNNGRFDLIRAREAVGMMRYEVLDATGRIIGQSGILSGPRTTIALDEASAGVYFLRLRHDGGTEVLRVVVQR